VENDRGGDEIVVSKPLLLLIRIVFRDDALASKSKPFGKRVVGLDDVGGRRDLPSERTVGEPFQQIYCPDHAADLLGDEEQLGSISRSSVNSELRKIP
jgi:hypothetical protein